MLKYWLVAASLTALCEASAARAQTNTGASAPQSVGTAAPAPSTSESGGVEEIVVTATRRAVDLQRVPATVEALPAATLASLDISNLLQLPDLVPGLYVTPAGGNNLYLRGVGTPSTGFNEAQVAIYLDGVYLANPALSVFSFNNIDQIEVLKGPQGTLYGRNATAGLISITTRNPGGSPRLDVSGSYGNYDTWTGNLYASTPITNTLSANVSIFNFNQADGWGKNVYTGHQDDLGSETGFESKLLWQPASKTDVTLSFIYDTNNRDYGYALEVLPGTIANDGTPNLGKYRSSDRIDPMTPLTAYIGSLKLQQDLGFVNFMSLTAYQTSKQHVLFPGSSPNPGNPIAGESVTFDNAFENNRTWSQEFQFTSKRTPTTRFDWVAGAFIYHDKTQLTLDSFTDCNGTVCTPGVIPTKNVGNPTTESYSGYADASYRFFDATHLTVGLRYTDESKGLTGLATPLAGFPDSVATLPTTVITYPGEPFAGFPNGIPTSLHFDKLTYRVVLAQDLGENVHAYVSDNLGFKSGAYNANVFTNPPALPEQLNAYEAGVKSELLDRAVRLNLSYFYYNYSNVQVRSTAPPAPPGNTFLENAADEHIKGVDGDFTIVPQVKGLTINGGFELLDAKYANFPGTTCTTPGTKVVGGLLIGTVTAVTCNLAGKRVPYSPPLSLTAGFVYKIVTPHGDLAFSANDRYTTKFPMVADGTISEAEHNIVDASLTWTAPGRHWDLQFYVRNLTNEYTYAAALVSTSYAISPGPPRIFGATLGYHY